MRRIHWVVRCANKFPAGAENNLTDVGVAAGVGEHAARALARQDHVARR
jgi:hypothetical protein